MSGANKAPIVKLAHGSRYHCFWVVQGCCIFSLHFSFPCFSYFFCGATSSYMFSITSFFVDQQKGCIFPWSPLTSWAQMSHLPEVRRDWQQNSELTQDLLLLQKVIYVEPANQKPHSECFLVLNSYHDTEPSKDHFTTQIHPNEGKPRSLSKRIHTSFCLASIRAASFSFLSWASTSSNTFFRLSSIRFSISNLTSSEFSLSSTFFRIASSSLLAVSSSSSLSSSSCWRLTAHSVSYRNCHYNCTEALTSQMYFIRQTKGKRRKTAKRQQISLLVTIK